MHKWTIEEDEAAEAEKEALKRAAAANGDTDGVDDLGVGDEEETPDLSLLDPKEWKVSYYDLRMDVEDVADTLAIVETRPL